MKHKGIEASVCYGFICFEYKYPKDIWERTLATSMLLFMIYETINKNKNLNDKYVHFSALVCPV